jgi:hypothetical protein
MKRLSGLTIPLFVLSGWTRAEAADFSHISDVSVILNLVILAGTVSCLIVALKVLSLVRGGALSRPWQLFIVSFISLAAAQVLALFQNLDILRMTFDLSSVLYVATVILWFAGIFHTRKVLG